MFFYSSYLPSAACARGLQYSSCLLIYRSVDLSTSDLSNRLVLKTLSEVPNLSRQQIFKKKATEHRLCDHAQSTAHIVLFGKHHCIVVFYRQLCVSFLYLSCSAIMDSPDGEFDNYKVNV